MPGRNGMGPAGQGAGRGRGRGNQGFGQGGNCACPSCGHRQPHVMRQPCNQTVCPKCGAQMVRET